MKFPCITNVQLKHIVFGVGVGGKKCNKQFIRLILIDTREIIQDVLSCKKLTGYHSLDFYMEALER